MPFTVTIMNESPVTWIWFWWWVLTVPKTIKISVSEQAGKKLVWCFIYCFISGATHSDTSVPERSEAEKLMNELTWTPCTLMCRAQDLGTQSGSNLVDAVSIILLDMPTLSAAWKNEFSHGFQVWGDKGKKITTLDCIYCSQQYRKGVSDNNK